MKPRPFRRSPTLAEVLETPTLASEVPSDQAAGYICHLAAVQTMLAARMAPTAPSSEDEPDQLLTADEAAQRLNVSKDWLYRHAATLPFTVRPTPKRLRFSGQGIAAYIEAHRGQPVARTNNPAGAVTRSHGVT